MLGKKVDVKERAILRKGRRYGKGEFKEKAILEKERC